MERSLACPMTVHRQLGANANCGSELMNRRLQSGPGLARETSGAPSQARILQRKCACGQHASGGELCDECQKQQMNLQRHSDGLANPAAVPAVVHDALRSPGQALDAHTRTSMEASFGHDFSDVRVHTDSRAAESARAVNASAYTVGQDIVFGEGGSLAGDIAHRRLLAHELTHVLQQTAATGEAGSAPDRELEREADQTSAEVLAGAEPRVTPASATGALQRQEKTAKTQEPAPPVKKGLEKRPNTGRGGSRFDAVLDREASLLTITMRLSFKFVESPLADHPWTHDEQSKFKASFLRQNVERWSKRYVLVPSSPCPTEPMKKVRVAVIPVEDDNKPHRTFTVNNSQMLEKSGVSPFDNTGNLNISDVTPHRKTESETDQTTGEHEFGHALGLHHISCPGNQPECYGPKGSQEEKDIMGKGSDVSLRDYEVFSEVLKEMTGCTWTAKEDSISFWTIAAIVGGILLAGGLAVGIGLAAASQK